MTTVDSLAPVERRSEPVRRNEGHDYREQLGPQADGRRLLPYLVDRYPHSASEQWQARIESGLVLVDGRPARVESVLRRGQILVWRRPGWEEPEAPLGFAILHEDEDLMALAKPAGLPTLPGAGFLGHTLLGLVRAYDPRATPLHRLGRFTSGIVLFARSGLGRAELSRQWAAREVRKRYRALAAGAPERDEFHVDVPIGPVPHAALGTIHAASPTGRAASTLVTVLERRDAAFLCDVRIETGRPHQVRIHLAAAGHPLVGDPLYGPGGVPRRGSCALPGDPGYRLHAAALSFRRPRSGDVLTLECAPPLELR